MEKTISIDGQEIQFKATAGTPRVYRQAFGRDIYKDISLLYKDYAESEDLSVESLNAFENIAFCMYAQANGVELKRDTVEQVMSEWLDQFSTFSIYKILPRIIELWSSTTEQTSKPKNQDARQSDH